MGIGTDSLEVPGVAPMSQRELQILGLFRRAFERDDIALDADFFELGGDSMLANRLLMRLTETYHIELPPDLLFRSPTPRLLAQALDDERAGTRVEGGAGLVPLNRVRDGLPVFLVHPVSGQPWVFQLLVEQADLNRPIYATRAPDLDWDRDVLTAAEMAQYDTAAIRTVQRRGPYSIAGFSWGGTLAFDIAMRLLVDGQPVRHLILFDTGTPPPMWRRVLSKTGIMRWLRWRLTQLDVGPRVFDMLGEKSRLLRAAACLGPGPLTPLELRSMLRMAFPDYAKSHDLRAMSFEDLCRTLVAEFRRVLSDERMAKLLGPTEISSIKAHKVDAKNHWLARWHAPAAVFPGTITIYASEGNPKVLRWQRFSSQPLDVRRVLAGSNMTRAHQAFLESPIVERFARDFKDLLEAPDQSSNQFSGG